MRKDVTDLETNEQINHRKIDPHAGLTLDEVNERVLDGRKNNPLKPMTRSIKRIFADNTLTLFNLINVTIACFIIYTGSYKNLLFLGVALCNTAMGIFQEIRAKRQVDKLTILTQAKVKVVRSGVENLVEQPDLVQDDVMVLAAGDQVCADGIVLETTGLEVDESQLTGEADAVRKTENDEIMSGSFIISGRAYVQATAIGAESFISKLSLEAKQEKTVYSELLRSIKTIIKILTFIIIPLGLILFFSQLSKSGDINASILGTAAAMIGMIPEGLVLLTSIALAVGVINLAKHRVLVKTMPAIETLARVDVLCLDKTGTITNGNLNVTDVLPEHNYTVAEMDEAIAAIVYALNDNNATSLALQKAFPNNPGWQATEKIPFSSDRKWSGATFGHRGTYIIGAPEFVFREMHPKHAEKVTAFAEKGYRVLCLAKKAGSFQAEPTDLQLVGHVLVADELRNEARDTFRYFKEQGVSIRVISGDNPVTVSNVAMQAEIENGDRFIDMSRVGEGADFAELVREFTVFGRVTPHQKKQLILAFQSEGHTVAMTGDGVNDVLALKESNCSIAMAEGSDATTSVADFVLLDNNFDSMIHVLKEGRRVINNIERVASLYLIKTIYSVILTIIFTFVNSKYPFQPIQLSPISSLTVGIPSFFLAIKPNYKRIQGEFLKKVLHNAFPAAFAVVTYIIVTMLLGQLVHLTFEQTSTINVLLTGAVCFTTLITVAKPFDFKIKVLIRLLMTAFVCLFLFAGQFFSLAPIWNVSMAMIYVPLLISVYPYFHFIRAFMLRFFK
ncbi:cation-translocating P-type ATPase [Listeria sp. ILCC797]|uniref:cation-translocating P-type ATPase n=1 Tax=Listeria sp. ILCC797 TaxID=1918333 RepID=UPI000B5975EA|nr:cation-translocating P-type ATPase [Listeria sp. ILCC797]